MIPTRNMIHLGWEYNQNWNLENYSMYPPSHCGSGIMKMHGTTNELEMNVASLDGHPRGSSPKTQVEGCKGPNKP